jgi:hypothetical protein
MSSHVPSPMNRSWPIATNPRTETRNHGTHHSRRRAHQPGPLTRHLTHLNRPSRRPGHSRRTTRQSDAATSFVHTPTKQKPPLTRGFACPRWDSNCIPSLEDNGNPRKRAEYESVQRQYEAVRDEKCGHCPHPSYQSRASRKPSRIRGGAALFSAKRTSGTKFDRPRRRIMHPLPYW